MDPLGGVSPSMESLRRQMAENLTHLRKAGELPASAHNAPRGPRSPIARLRQTLIRRLGSLSAQDPVFTRKATTLFVESTLLAEFGEALTNEPEFRLLIRDVVDTLLGDPDTAQQLASVLDELLTASR